MSAESNRYNPYIHDEPNTFIDALPPGDPKINLRKSSVLAAAFTPFIRDFKEKLSDYSPYRAESIRDDVEIGIYDYPQLSNTAILEIFDSEIYNPSEYFSSFSQVAESRYLGNSSYRPLDSLVIVPVGFYGGRFAKATAMSGSVLSELAGRVMKEESNKLVRSPYEQIIRKETFMHSPHTSLAEGMQTTAASIGLLTSEGIPGYEDDPIEGMQQLIDQKVFQHFAALAPTGIVIPMPVSGLRFKQPLISDNNGNLRVNSQLNELFRIEKKTKLAKKENKTRDVRGTLSEGCPVARPHVPEVTIFGDSNIISESGVQMGMSVFMEYLKYYYSKEL